MKDLKEYIIERGPAPKVSKEDMKKVPNLDVVWIIKDKDLDGAIIDVCDTEDDANKTGIRQQGMWEPQ